MIFRDLVFFWNILMFVKGRKNHTFPKLKGRDFLKITEGDKIKKKWRNSSNIIKDLSCFKEKEN